MRCQVVGVIIALVHVARAQPQYPESYADRPLTLLDGMTELVVDGELRSSSGHTFDGHTPDVAVAHAFGPVEIFGDIGQDLVLRVTVQLPDLPLAVRVAGASGAPQADDSLHLDGSLSAVYKQPVVPGAFAVLAAATLRRNDNRIRNVMNELVWTHVYDALIGVSGELQLMPTLALIAGLGFDTPFAEVGPTFRSTFSANGTLVLTVAHSWDLYVLFALGDLAENRLPYLEAGFEKRWGG